MSTSRDAVIKEATEDALAEFNYINSVGFRLKSDPDEEADFVQYFIQLDLKASETNAHP